MEVVLNSDEMKQAAIEYVKARMNITPHFELIVDRSFISDTTVKVRPVQKNVIAGAPPSVNARVRGESLGDDDGISDDFTPGEGESSCQ